ncbi:MAG: MFS transporter [Solirubrobacterales bacterium]
MRRLLVLTSTMVFLDVAVLTAIAPLLPTYVDELGLSKAAAGILSASYAAGTLIFALPAGYVASRVGPRRTVIGGLLLLGAASLAFGFARNIYLLDSARLVQGAAGSLIWSGSITWLITSAPDEERGSMIGFALGTAVAGALLGPALGAAAASIGTGPVFSAVLVVAFGLAFAATRIEDAHAPASQSLGEVIRTLLSRPLVVSAAFVAVPSMMFGAVEVLVPLRIDALGGGHGVIAGGFIVGAGLEAFLAPFAGRLSDRTGRRLPYVVGLTICAAAMAAFALAAALGGVLAALIVTSLGAGLCFAPAMTLISDAAEASDLHQGFAAGVSNMAWASGQVVGGIGGGVVAGLTGNALPSLLIAAALMATVAYAFRALQSPPQPRPAEG